MNLYICDRKIRKEPEYGLHRVLGNVFRSWVFCEICEESNIFTEHNVLDCYKINELSGKRLEGIVRRIEICGLMEKTGCIMRLIKELSFTLRTGGKMLIMIDKRKMQERLKRLPYSTAAEVILSYHAESKTTSSNLGDVKEFYQAGNNILELSARASGSESAYIYKSFQFTGYGLMCILLDTYLLGYHDMKPSLRLKSDDNFWVIESTKIRSRGNRRSFIASIQKYRLDIMIKSKLEYSEILGLK